MEKITYILSAVCKRGKEVFSSGSSIRMLLLWLALGLLIILDVQINEHIHNVISILRLSLILSFQFILKVPHPFKYVIFGCRRSLQLFKSLLTLFFLLLLL